MGEIRVRTPVAADGPQIGRLIVRAWKKCYAGLMPSAFLARLDEVERGEAWQQRLVARARGNAADGDAELLVAERRRLDIEAGAGAASDAGTEVLGVATIGADRDDPTRSRGELWMINVVPEAWGTGVGPALLKAAVERLAARGFDTAVLWVVAGNTRARRFYEREGWVPDGDCKEQEFGGQSVKECRYRRDLLSW